MEEEIIPKAVVGRIAKQGLPENVLIATESKNAIAYAAKTFILYLTACANDICHADGKTKLTHDHVLKAIEELEFPFGKELKDCLDAYRSESAEKKQKKTNSKEEEEKEVSHAEEDINIEEDMEKVSPPIT